jgi:hypothetical protein
VIEHWRNFADKFALGNGSNPAHGESDIEGAASQMRRGFRPTGNGRIAPKDLFVHSPCRGATLMSYIDANAGPRDRRFNG